MHLGFKEPQGWTRKAALRTAPTAMLLYSFVVLWFAREGHRHYQPPHRPWYSGKSTLSFADILATLQQTSIRQQVYALHPTGRGSKNVVKALLHAYQRAA